MLAHQNQESEGTVPDAVNITDRTINNARDSGTCHSGVRFGAAGALFKIQPNGGLSAVSGQWLVTGAASGFYLRRTIISGTLEDDDGGTIPVGEWIQMNANLDYDNQKSSSGFKSTTAFFEISSDVSGVPVVDTATMTFTSEQGLS